MIDLAKNRLGDQLRGGKQLVVHSGPKRAVICRHDEIQGQLCHCIWVEIRRDVCGYTSQIHWRLLNAVEIPAINHVRTNSWGHYDGQVLWDESQAGSHAQKLQCRCCQFIILRNIRMTVVHFCTVWKVMEWSHSLKLPITL